MAEVTIKNIYKNYNPGVAKDVLRDINLDIKEGEFIVFVGPSGCGKSTLLRLIAGLDDITRGELYIGGKLMNNVAPVDRGVGMVFQSYALYPHMNVRENMAFGLKIKKFDKKTIKERVTQASAMLGLDAFLERKPKALSGGQRQRVAIGRAIVREPHIFLFDEPLSNLDAELRMQMRVEINKLHRRLGTTMIFVTHDQVEAMTLADRIVVLRKGIVEQVGTPLELYNRPENIFVAGFLGSPRMNFLEGKVKSVEGHHAAIELKGGQTLHSEFPTAPAPGAPVTLGVRPEDLVPVGEGEGILIGDVQLAEQLGGETYVYVALPDGSTVTAEFKGQAKLAAGDRLHLAIDNDKFHVFGADEKVIRHA